MGSYQEERERFVGVWARNGGRYTPARLVLKYAKTIDREATAECNGEAITPLRQARLNQALRAIESACKESGFSVRFGGDPRGYTTKIAFPDGSFNTWGGRDEGWGVPTR